MLIEGPVTQPCVHESTAKVAAGKTRDISKTANNKNLILIFLPPLKARVYLNL